MIIFIIYLLILTQVLQASFEPILTENFIKPAINLTETQDNNQITFIGFEGKPGNYKKAQLYTINKKGELEENKNFNFNLSPLEINTFFSAHKGSFTEQNKEEVVILVSSPTAGTKVYLWERNPKGGFKRTYKNPTTINPNHPSSQPIEAITTHKNENQNNLTISFGSPNRNIVVLDFTKEKININNNIATEFLQNQAGSIFIRDFSEEKTKPRSLYVFNSGNPKTSITTKNKETKKQNYNFKGPVNDIYIKKNTNEAEKIFLISNNSLFFSKSNQKVDVEPGKKYSKVLFKENNLFWLLDEKGFPRQAQVNLKEKTLKETPLFLENQVKPTYLEFMYNDNKILISKQTNKQNTIQQFVLQQKEENQQEERDTLIIITNTEKTIPILLDEKLNFVKLTTTEQPSEMELDLVNLSYVWEPKSKDAGFHNLKYNIIYNEPGKITKETNEEGNANLNQHKKQTNKTHHTTLFVNDPPTIKIDSIFSVLSEHQISIPITIIDNNKKQKIQTSYSPPKEGAEINNDNFIWKPSKSQKGTHKIEFTANDGISTTTTTVNVIVDTTTQTTKITQEFILTVNKEFTLDLQEKKTYISYNIKTGPENIWISKAGKLHWIPIETQLGNNEINIERIGKDTRDNIIISTFVNSPPIISYRPDKIEYINKDEEFIFTLQAFDANVNQKIFWLLSASPEEMILNNENQISYIGKNLDYNTYIIEATDSIDTGVFYGQIYVNDIAKIVSKPPKVIQLGEKLHYNIEVEDKNKQNPNNKEKINTFIYAIIKGPQQMKLINSRLQWSPEKKDVGSHEVEISITNGIDSLKHSFSLYVNEAPEIISTNKLKILVGDTLTHLITTKDQTNKLTFSIRTKIQDMYLNASTGEIHWIPKEEDIGLHMVEVAVSDGFEKSDDIQELEIIVQGYPKFLSTPPTEAYVGLEYKYYIEAQNAQEQKTPHQDFFISIEETTFSNMELDTTNYILFSTPKPEDAGEQKIKLKLSDDKDNQIIETFKVLVIETSPCETDTLIIQEENKKEKTKPPNHKPPLFKIPS